MEVVASRVEQLEKSKIQPVPTAQTTPAPSKPKPKRRKTESAYAEWDQKKYKGTDEERRKDRENRRLIREQKRKAEEEDLAKRIKDLAPLGEDDDNDDGEQQTAEKQTEQEEAPKKKGNKDTPASRNKRMEMERRRTEKAAREAEKAKAAEQTVEEKSVKSPAAKKAKSPGRADSTVKSPGRAKPTVKSPGRAKPTVKSPGRSDSTVKSPKSKPKVKSPGRQSSRNQEKRDDDTTNRKVEPEKGTKPTGKDNDETSRVVAKKKPTESTPKTATKHIDDDDYDLDLRTGKFVKKKKQKPPVLEDDDDDDLEEIDDVDKDHDFDPDKEDDQGDEDDDGEQELINDDDDDFPIPLIRVKKQSKGDKSTKKRKQTSKEAVADLADFVEDTFVRPTRQRKAKGQDACINPEEAARFQKAMKAEALELEKAVKNGRNVATAYKTLVTHVIEACKDMKYDIPADLEADDIFPTIADPNCKAWMLKLQGIQTAGEGELNVSKTDNAGVCVAKKKYSIGDVMSYVEEVSSDWNKLKRKNFLITMKKVMGNMAIAHKMVADASQELINLLDEVDLPLWIKLADITMRPLVHLEIPDVVIMCEEAKQVCKANEQSWDQTTKITAIMESQCLPFLPTAWGYDREGRAKKVVAGIIYKYVKDRMYGGKVETPATEVSEKFGFNATTINRHILGKKYAGGKASGSGTARRPAAIKRTAVERKGKDKPTASASKPATDRAVEKSTVEGEDDDDNITKSKGTASKPATDRAVEKSTVEGEDDDDNVRKTKGKGKSSGTKRPAKDIRDDSKSEKEKERTKKRKTEEAELDEELVADPDMPTPKEKQAAMAALASKGYKQKGVIIH